MKTATSRPDRLLASVTRRLAHVETLLEMSHAQVQRVRLQLSCPPRRRRRRRTR